MPTYVSAPVLFTPREEGVFFERSILTAFRYADGARRHKNDIEKGKAAFYGPNQGFKLHTKAALDAVVELPHYWPKEDVAMAKTIVNNGGTMHQSLDLRATASSQVSRAMPPLLDWIRKTPEKIDEEIITRYRMNAPEDSVTYLD